MKRILISFFILALAGAAAMAQTTRVYAVRDTLELRLDIHYAEEGSETSFQGIAKPTILFVFGGGFVSGSRNDEWYFPWFHTMNGNGYNVVAIDYRLGMKGYKMGKGLRGAVRASDQFYLSQQMGVEDVFAAVEYLSTNEELGIDVDNMVLAGNSAGAIISLATEYDILRGRRASLPEGFNFKGVMSFAGAIISTSGAPDFPSQPCPILLLHGTADRAVAYKHYGAFGRGIWGSDYIAKRFAKKGFFYSIYRYLNRTHDVAAYVKVLWDLEKDFLEQDVMLGRNRTIDATVDDPSLPSWGDISTDDIYK